MQKPRELSRAGISDDSVMLPVELSLTQATDSCSVQTMLISMLLLSNMTDKIFPPLFRSFVKRINDLSVFL